MFRDVYLLTICGFFLCTKGVNSDIVSDCSKALGVGDKNKITDAQMSASSSRSSRHRAYEGRLNNQNREWCPYDDNNREWLQVDFNETKIVSAVSIDGDHTSDLFVASFALLYSYNGVNWYNYTDNTQVHIFPGQTWASYQTAKKITIPKPITTRFIRINPRTWSKLGGGFCLKVEFYGCLPKNEDCRTPVGVEDRKRIKDSQMSASSTYNQHYPYNGRLNNNGVWAAWCTELKDQYQYLQVDLLRKRNVSGVATQGYRLNMYVKKYKLNYSTDGKNWIAYRNKRGDIEFSANEDNDTVQKTWLDSTVAAKYIRFNPTVWNRDGYICMRVEIYECLPVKGSVPNVQKYLPTFSDVDKGGSINLTCVMRGQAEIVIHWYKQNVLVQQSNSSLITSRRIGQDRMESTLLLSDVGIGDNGKKYECRGSYPGVNFLSTSTKTVLRVGADQPALRKESTTSTTVELSVPYRSASGTQGYQFQYRVKNSEVKQWKEQYFDSGQDNVYTIKNLKPWTFYEVRVTPIHKYGNKGGKKGRTSVILDIQTAEGVPGPPRRINIIRIHEYNATVTWEPPRKEDIHGVITKYIIEYKSNIDENPLIVDEQQATNHTLVSLLPTTTYTVQISAVTGGGQSLYSNASSFTTKKEIIDPATTPKPVQEKVNLERLNKINITRANVISVANDVKNLTSETDKLKAKDVAIIAQILEKILDTDTKDPKVGDSILGTISQVLDVKNNVLVKSNTTSKFVKVLDEYVENGGEFSKNTTNILVSIDRIEEGRIENIRKEFDKNVSIEIPKEALDDAVNKTISFIYYKNGKLFHPKRFIKEKCLESGFTEDVYETSTAVLSSSIMGKTVKNLSTRVIINFTVANPKAVKESSSCVYWDFHKADGKGEWSRKGCKRQRVYGNVIECACDHMTNFAALIDVYAETSKACGVHGDILTIISYCGCVLSIIGLLLTIFTFLFFRRLRKQLAAKILLQLCIALLCVLVVFLFGIERARVGPIGCYIVAVLLHYFVLAAFMWMLVEAHFMYLAFVKVWTQHGEHELLKCSLIAWGLPAIAVGITMAVNLDNYGGDHYCRIKKTAFFAAFFGPIMCILFVNLVIFCIILYKLNTRPDSSLARERSAIAERMKQAVGIMILVGITWVFGALAISKARLIFHYLFVAFNSVQGFSIFLFYCLSKRKVRNSWKALLTCQLEELENKDKSFYTNTYERRRCSTGSTTHNTTLSLSTKKTSTSSQSSAFPSHSMDTLTREFTSYNCTSGTLRLSSGSKQSNLNNFVSKENNPGVWKRMSNVCGDSESNNRLSGIPLSRSSDTLCSDDNSDKSYSYDLVDDSNFGSRVSFDSNLSKSSDKKGFYSFVNSRDSLGSSYHDSTDNSFQCEHSSHSAPGTPYQIKRPCPSPLSRKKQTTLPSSFEKPNNVQELKPRTSESLGIRDDFGKLIMNPCRGSIRGVIGVVETSVDTYDDDSPSLITPQGVRLTQDVNADQREKFDPNECIASPAYFAENGRINRGSKDRNASTNDSPIGDVYL